MFETILIKNLVFVSFLIISLPEFHQTIDVERVDTSLNQTNQVFTFANHNSFIRIDANNSWNIMTPRELVFQFKTDRPHGLLFYQTVVNPMPGTSVYELYLMLENGRLKIIHEFGAEQKSFYIGQGLNHDLFHVVRVTINPINGSLTGVLDNLMKNHKNNGMRIELTSLANYVQKRNPYNSQSVLYFGGLDNKRQITHQQYSVKRFIGCIGKIKFRTLSTQMTESGLNSTKYKFFNISESEGLQYNCLNLCKKLDLCANRAQCVNHYTYTSCDCFGTKREDWHCRSHNISILTLRGYSFVSHKIYDYKNKIHSDVNRISFHMKSQTKNQILVYGRGEQPIHNYIAIHLKDGFLHFQMDLGDGPVNASIGHIILSDNKWHNITVRHRLKNINLYIDDILEESLELPGNHHHLHVDPEIFFGGVPNARFKPELVPFDMNYRFVGCFKFVYFNEINILYELNHSNKASKYHSVFAPEFGCSAIDPIPITMSTKKSHFIINVSKSPVLKMTLEFKSEKSDAILASGSLRDSHNNTDRYWFLHLGNSEAKFTISSSNSSLMPLWSVSSGVKHLLNFWQQISLESDGKGNISIISNYKYKNEGSVEDFSIEYFNSNVSFGAGFLTNSSAIEGVRGCLRDISINDIEIDPRVIYSKYAVIGKISLDNCQLIDPCNSPNLCEHGGQCIASLEDGTTRCNCDKTGYVGKTCHFSLYKRTCEELYLAGYHKTGIYKIDIDRNGPLPPAHVICSMSKNGMIETIIEHNIRHQVVVRERGTNGNFYLNVTYREFTPEMINSLIKHSNSNCSQYIKYECNSAPLGLSSYTWMQSTEVGYKVTSIGSGQSGQCKCWSSQNCVDRTKHCNCDSETIGWKHDEGDFTDPRDVGITRMFFLQNKNLKPDSEAHLILGNVSCINSNTREYEITFQTKESYLEVSGWEGGDMAVSFRTTATKAVIFYQAPLHSHHGYFKAILSGEYEITFEFLVNSSPRTVKLKSGRRLNTGEWQQIWVDSDAHHMRFTVNINSELFDLEDDDEFNAFEGPLFVGGAPKHLLLNSEVRTGFIGCLRGLVLNDKVVNLYKHLHRKSTNIEKKCRPLCKPDNCQNGATCVELWGSYECKCANPISQSGKNCEHDINTNSMTFITPSSYYQKLAEGKEVNPILEKDIIISFRTHMRNALIFYANDYMNNFVQLHIENGTHVVFTFNSFDRVVRGAVQPADLLTSGNPIQIKVDRSQRRKTILTANDASIIIDHSIKFLTKYSQKPWKSGDEFELVKPARPPVPIEAHSQLFVGGVDEVGATSQIQGIVGCLQGFVIGDKLFNLTVAAQEPSTVAIGQIKPGCNMLCDRLPCLNGGACTEDWKNNQFHCNCSMTSYGGNTCNSDVGARFDGHSLVRYTFQTQEKSFHRITVHLAFSTDKRPDTFGRTMLVVSHSTSSTLIHISLMADQSILVEEVNKDSKYSGRVILTEEFSFADGQRHWLLYTREHKSGQLIVDSEIYDISFESKLYENNFTNEDNLVLVGAVNRNDIRLENFTNFIGCVSNVLIELNDLKLEPLESAFGGRSDLAAVKVEGDIKQGLCAEFKVHVPVPPISPDPEGDNIESDNELWNSPPEPKLVPFKTKPLLLKSGEQINKTPIYISCVGFLSIVILFVLIYMWNLQRNYKIKRFQGETPFFHSKRNSNSSTRSKEMKFHMISNEDNEAAVKLLQHQEMPANGSPQESHPLEERINSENFKEDSNETQIELSPDFNDSEIIDRIKRSEESQQTMPSRVRFADTS